MVASRTLEEIRGRVRFYADIETSTPTTGFVKNARLDEVINAAIETLYNKLILTWGDEFYSKNVDVPILVDKTDYTLPDDFFLMSRVIVSDQSTLRLELPKWNWADLADLLQHEQSGYVGIYIYRYRLRGDVIEIRPKPSATDHTLKLYYTPRFEPLIEAPGEPNSFDGINGWEMWAVYQAAMDLLAKEESTEQFRMLQQRQQILSDQIDKIAGNRDAGRPPRVGDALKDFAWADWGQHGYHRREPWPT